MKRGARGGQADVVEKLIEKLEKKLIDDAEVKATVGDYIRLMQLHKELKEDEPKDIEVKWIDQGKEDPGGAK